MTKLEWKTPKCEGYAKWEAEPRSARHFDAYYTTYSWKGNYAYFRPNHPLLGEFNGVKAGVDEAKLLCQEDWETVERLDRWIEYIKNNEPPT